MLALLVWGLIFLGILLGCRLWPRPALAQMFPNSSVVLAADGSLLRMTTAADEQYRYWVVLEDIAPVMVEAMLAQEDQWFYWHPGVNPLSLARAVLMTYSGGARQGGSTLTMQLARLLERRSTGTPWAKLHQIIYALQLELFYSKHDILEAYLNYAPFGGNVQGVGAASYLYFGKTAATLGPAEAALLAVIPQKPNARPRDRQDTLAAAGRLRERWLQSWPAYAQQLSSLDVPLLTVQQRPFLAPHVCDQLLRGVHDTTLRTTLELPLQGLLERQVRLHRQRLARKGIHNASAMLVDWRNGEVKALVGSADYFDRRDAGQVNGTAAKRSPGSTLKPLLYALAMEQGLIHPLSMLKDAPGAFGAYTPENFDGGFVGPISARDALIRSRNIPAVALAMQLPEERDLYALLRRGGVRDLRSREYYGLALVLGAGEVSMQELADLYVALANNGRQLPLQWLQGHGKTRGAELLMPEAAYLAMDMLAQNPRPNKIRGAKQHPWFTAWKTGTSWSFRDAWAAGAVGPYVLVVWAGNFSGESNPALVGAEAAGPLWWGIADALPSVSSKPFLQRPMPANLTHVDICAESGDLPDVYCPLTVSSWFIPGVSPIRVNHLHRPMMVNSKTGQLACPPYGPDDQQEVFAFWPSDLAGLFAQAGLPRRKPPVGQCNAALPVTEEGAPRILSPYTGLLYLLNPAGDDNLPLQASVSADVTRLYWFEQRALLGVSKPGEIFYWRPKLAGNYEISVVDDKGRSAGRAVRVEFRD